MITVVLVVVILACPLALIAFVADALVSGDSRY